MASGTFVLASFSFDLENILIWLVIGLVAGFLASRLVRGRGFGLIGDIVVGLLGALIGGFLADLLGINFSGHSRIGEAVIAFLGACILLLLIRGFRGGGKRR